MIIPGDQSHKRSCLHDKACDLDPRQKHEDEAKRIRMFLELRELQSNGAIRRYYQKVSKNQNMRMKRNPNVFRIYKRRIKISCTKACRGRKGNTGMEITDVRVRKVALDGKMRAIVSITLDNEFVVHDIKVIEGEKGVFVAMPSRKSATGEYRDIAHPINSETRDYVQKIILEKYEEALQEA